MTSADMDLMFESLNFEAPFLIEKLLKEQVAETMDEATELFGEVKKYIVLAHVDRTRRWRMHSLRVDEAWHQFVLFTKEYIDYCNRFFGQYIQHYPGNAPGAMNHDADEASSTFGIFSERYEELFGMPLPNVWYDERNVTPRRRVVNYNVGRWTFGEGDGTVDLLNEQGDTLLSVNALARDALAFMACTGAFYTRELPGDLTDDEKIMLVATLVRCKLLRSAP